MTMQDKGGPVGFGQLPQHVRVERTRELAAAARSDVERWADVNNLHQNWSRRAQIVATLIPPSATVLDIGCGRMDLRNALSSQNTYIPCDIVARNEHTIVCDLNKGELPDCDADVVTMLGVLEYIHDAEILLARLGQRWRHLLFTYHPGDLDKGRERGAHGWFNSHSMACIVGLAMKGGWSLSGIVPLEPTQHLFEMRR